MLCTICKHSAPDASFGEQCPEDESYLVDEVSHREGQGDPLLGRLIGGEFAIVGIIGSGGFGSVYRSIQQPIGRTVAVKILHGHAYRRPEVRRRFVREAKALARLSDPNIVQFIRFSEVKSDSGRLGQDFFFIAQEYVDGVHLGQIIKTSVPIPWTRVKFLTRSILKALAAAHKQNITHRDLKPTNIMVCEDAFQGDLVKVLDFGIAKFLADQDEEEDHTVTGTLLGTPNYMSPEQIRNQPVGPASDLYAVGILMYEMLTGKRPFHRDSKIDTLRAHLEGAIPDLTALPLAAQKIIAVALCKVPTDRYASARDMAEALDRMDSLGSFTSDGATKPHSIIDIHSIVDLSAEEATSVDSTSVVVDRMHQSIEETINIDESPKPLSSVILLAVLGCIIGCLVWWVQVSGQRFNTSATSKLEAAPAAQRPAQPVKHAPAVNSLPKEQPIPVPVQPTITPVEPTITPVEPTITPVEPTRTPQVQKVKPRPARAKPKTVVKRRPAKKQVPRKPRKPRQPEKKKLAPVPIKRTVRRVAKPIGKPVAAPISRPVEIQEL
jgi:serine/threonine protein kinase